MPEGVFSLLYGGGRKVGQAVVKHPVTQAVGFTGSRAGGLALMNHAAARAVPIPVYAEMSSVNPVVLMPGVIFDARSVVLSMAGLFGGPLVACIAAAMAATGRLWLGGAGAEVGLMVIALCTVMGLLYREARARTRVGVRPVPMAQTGS